MSASLDPTVRSSGFEKALLAGGLGSLLDEQYGVGDVDTVATGHTHVPFVREIQNLTILNVGSVGQPRDGDPRACRARSGESHVTAPA